MADLKYLDTLQEVLLERGFPLDIVQSVLETVQTIDAVEVVRCKDCGRGKRGVDNIVLCNHPSGKRILMTAYGFCSSGERKQDV